MSEDAAPVAKTCSYILWFCGRTWEDQLLCSWLY